MVEKAEKDPWPSYDEKYRRISSARSHRTLRDFLRGFPRHFVPGYDRLSLRDEEPSQINSYLLGIDVGS